MALVDKAEQIMWWDAIAAIIGGNVKRALQMTQACLHPDAQWLVSLFPHGSQIKSEADMRDVLDGIEDDPRALYLSFCCGPRNDAKLLRAAMLGYAPAQALWSVQCISDRAESFQWAQKSAAQGDREGLYRLGMCWQWGAGCEKDCAKAFALFRNAAELGEGKAQVFYGSLLAENDWERYHWWSGCDAGNWGCDRNDA